MSQDRIERALEDDYLSRDPSTSSELLHPEDHGEREEMGRAITSSLRPLVILPSRLLSDTSSILSWLLQPRHEERSRPVQRPLPILRPWCEAR